MIGHQRKLTLSDTNLFSHCPLVKFDMIKADKFFIKLLKKPQPHEKSVISLLLYSIMDIFRHFLGLLQIQYTGICVCIGIRINYFKY